MNGCSIIVNSVAYGWFTAGICEDGSGGFVTVNGGYIYVSDPLAHGLELRSLSYINGGTIESSNYHIVASAYDLKVYFGTNEEGNGVTFVGGVKSHFPLNLLLSEDLGYYDADGNLVENADDVTEIIDKADITVKKLTN